MAQYADQLTEGAQGAAAPVQGHVLHERVPDAPHRRQPAADLRRDQAHRDHREARRRAATASPARSRASRSRSRSRASRCSGTTCCATGPMPRQRDIGQAAVTDERQRTHGEVPRRVLRRRTRLPSAKEADLDNVILYFMQEIVAPARLAGRDPAGARDARPGQGEPPRLDLQPRPAPRAPRAERRVRQSRHGGRRPAHHRPVRHVQRQPASATTGSWSARRRCTCRTTPTSCTGRR